MSNLASRYLGLELAHPVIASASPLTATFDGMRRLEDARAAAVVMASLFEEQIRAEDTRYATFTEYTAGCHPEAATYFPELPDYRYGVSGHIETLRRAAEALDIPVKFIGIGEKASDLEPFDARLFAREVLEG